MMTIAYDDLGYYDEDKATATPFIWVGWQIFVSICMCMCVAVYFNGDADVDMI